ncbi:hypothetical protein AMS68_002946 [Peltaster fructicola]|uniref:Uncharacterized protein n=1 Tax=Peltaster fructicola TaxID=286661 RepID=A0A6H0XS27_9PEZI|nr:hypothetical protein AMS68_002946 [Peltaster fructicola]
MQSTPSSHIFLRDLPQTVIEDGPSTEHKEKHSSSSELVRDCIIGMADGLTVPFALTAGLSALGSSRLVVIGGLAELFSGAISMGLGAYLASVTEKHHFDAEEKRERQEVLEKPAAEEEEIFEIFEQYGVSREAASSVVDALKVNEDMWVKFMMDFELKLSRPSSARAWIEGLVMGLSYFLGGLLPMIPYFAFSTVEYALYTSIGITAIVLLVFGYGKAIITGTNRVNALWSAGETLLVGALAAGVSYGIVRAVNSSEHL